MIKVIKITKADFYRSPRLGSSKKIYYSKGEFLFVNKTFPNLRRWTHTRSTEILLQDPIIMQIVPHHSWYFFVLFHGLLDLLRVPLERESTRTAVRNPCINKFQNIASIMSHCSSLRYQRTVYALASLYWPKKTLTV